MERITSRTLETPLAEDEMTSLMDASVDRRGNLMGYKPTPHNAALVIQNDRRTHGALAMDLFSSELRLTRKVDFETRGVMKLFCPPEGQSFNDTHEAALITWLGATSQAGGWCINASADTVGRAIVNSAHQNAYHPIYDKITEAPWDGTPVEHLLRRCSSASGVTVGELVGELNELNDRNLAALYAHARVLREIQEFEAELDGAISGQPSAAGANTAAQPRSGFR